MHDDAGVDSWHIFMRESEEIQVGFEEVDEPCPSPVASLDLIFRL